MNNEKFEKLPDNARPEDIARRIGAIVSVIDGGREMVLARFTAQIAKDWPDLKAPGLSASLKLRDTLAAAEGRDSLDKFTRRFLSKQFVRVMIDEIHPAYEQAMRAKNSGEVAATVRKGVGKAVGAPETAVFVKSRGKMS